mgnify:CR=1 FL=1
MKKQTKINIMATQHIESLMRNSAGTFYGWTKTTTENNKVLRSIKIGTQKSCNDDGLICDHTTESKIKNIFNKYNIDDYDIINIHTKYVFASEILLKEDVYNNLINKLTSDSKV